MKTVSDRIQEERDRINGKAQVWRPTMRLRWFIPDIKKNAELQQLWISTNGEKIWRIIDIEYGKQVG